MLKENLQRIEVLFHIQTDYKLRYEVFDNDGRYYRRRKLQRDEGFIA